jgi:hypothetical protein
MEPVKKDIKIKQGASLSIILTLSQADGDSYNLAGYTPTAQLRKNYSDSTAVDITCEVTSEEDGIITMSLTATDTMALTEEQYVYDLIITHSSGEVICLMEGMADIDFIVTRAEVIP